MIRSDRNIIVALLLLLAWPHSAAANPAKLHYKTGQAYYEEGAYARAIVEFAKAYELAKKPALLYNIGQCHERLGEVGKAITFFRRYLTESRRKDPALEKKIKNLQNRLAQTGIRVSCTVRDATVTIDGREVGKTPLDKVISVEPGQHQLTVSKEGYATYSLGVSVVAGSAVTVNAELSPAPAKPPEEKKQPITEKKQPEEAGAGQQKHDQPDQPESPEKPRKRLWTWIAFGTAGALIAGGAIFGGLALNKANDATATDKNGAPGMALAADILFGAGIAAAVTGTVLLFVEGRSEKSETAAVVIRPLVGPAYVGAGGTF